MYAFPLLVQSICATKCTGETLWATVGYDPFADEYADNQNLYLTMVCDRPFPIVINEQLNHHLLGKFIREALELPCINCGQLTSHPDWCSDCYEEYTDSFEYDPDLDEFSKGVPITFTTCELDPFDEECDCPTCTAERQPQFATIKEQLEALRVVTPQNTGVYCSTCGEPCPNQEQRSWNFCSNACAGITVGN